MNNIFSSKKSHSGLTIGDEIEYKTEEIKGTIIALGLEGFLYKEKVGNTYYSDYIETVAGKK